MQEAIANRIKETLKTLGIPEADFQVEPTELSKGDYASNVALVVSKQIGKSPLEIANLIRENISEIEGVEKIEVAGPGFLNFYLSQKEILNNLEEATNEDYGKNDLYSGQKVIIEYTDPNPFKQFHIGHLMSNTIGESLSRLYEAARAEVIRVTWQGDVGMHIAMAVWAIKNKKVGELTPDAKLEEKINFLGKSYAAGSSVYLLNEDERKEIEEINKNIYTRDNQELNEIYDKGRKWSLEHFEEIYKKLGSKFDRYFFESELGPKGLEIVKKNMGVFEESEGAVVFKGEKYGLHTRVFINSNGLPVYEAKELGLNKEKFDAYSPDLSVIVTGNEINEYFKVLLKVMSLVMPEVAESTKHVGHGMMRLASGKMSSRLGNVVTGEFMLAEVENMVAEKMADRNLVAEEKSKIISEVAVGAIKYSILKQSIGKDIHFDFEKSISFEGDSGPYMQYTAVRIKSLLEKAKEGGIEPNTDDPEGISEIERMLYRYPEIVKRASEDFAPQYVATYLIELCAAYNSYYASHLVIGDQHAAYRLYVSKAVLNVLTRGLWLLGIKVPEKM